jgi:hypothetical protein
MRCTTPAKIDLNHHRRRSIMSKMWTIAKDGTSRSAVSMDSFSRFLMKEAKRDPTLKFSMTDAYVCLSPGYGPAVATWTGPGAVSLTPVKIPAKGEVFLAIPPGQSLRIVHETDAKKSVTVENPPSGEARLAVGAALTPPKAVPEGLTGDLNAAAHTVVSWFLNGDVGNSSRALADHLVRVPAGMIASDKVKKSAPFDDYDARRCLLLLRSLPESFQDLSSMSAVSDEWKNWLTADDAGVTPWAAAVARIDAAAAVGKGRARKP